jgi:HD superfamily phosphohydrolase
MREKYPSEPEPISSDILQKLRLAAILHDCSHGPFSHTSEEVYRLFKDMQALIAPGCEFEGLSPSEVLAAHILDSDAFAGFFKAVEARVPLHFEPAEIKELILGRRLDKLRAYETDIINGPFDADKLDYIFRDAHYSGLPLSVDLDRLWFATEIHVLSPSDVEGLAEQTRRLVVSRAGVNSLEQIVAARMNLTSSFYHHHKIRACDCIFKAVVEYCQKHGVPLCGQPLESSADFLFITDVSFLAESERSPDSNVREMTSRIVRRRLLKRALVIAMNTFETPSAGKSGSTDPDEDHNKIWQMISGKEKPQGARRLRELAEAIWKEAGRLGRIEEVWLDFPDAPKLGDLSRTFVNIGSPDRPDFRTLNDFIPLDQWGKQYVLNKWRGHVFCSPEHVEAISQAAQKVLEAEYRVKFNKYARLLANLAA